MQFKGVGLAKAIKTKAALELSSRLQHLPYTEKNNLPQAIWCFSI